MNPEVTPFADRKMTSGAIRIMEKVRERVLHDGVPLEAAAQVLLQELLAEENQATELLKLPRGTLPVWQFATQNLLPGGNEAFAEWQLTLLRHADRFAIHSAVEAVTGTEHLLLASLKLDRAVQEFLGAHGIELHQLVDQLTIAEPKLAVAPDDEILIAPAGVGRVDEATLHRILDASGNRCREGLRVVEDFVRFGLDDAIHSQKLKELRHEIAEIMKYLQQERWILSRDTTHDVGTQSSTRSEAFRGTPVDVLRASMKRVEEALRSLEEYSKLIDADLSKRLEAARYHFYTIEKALEGNLNSRQRLQTRSLYLLVTSENCRYGIKTTVRDTIAKGVDLVQLREKNLTDRALIALGKQVREWTYEHDALFIMNDRPDLALACGADGVHLGQDEMEVHEARKIMGSQKLIGVSTHDLGQVQRAIYDGADYLGVGPIFPSQTKRFSEFVGLEFVQEVAQATSLPWFAIGGIDQSNLDQVIRAGATRIAVSGTICKASDPRGVALDLSEKLRSRAAHSGTARIALEGM